MKKLLIPILLLIVGIGGGVGAGLMLVKPEEDLMAENPCGDVPTGDMEEPEMAKPAEPEELETREYARMNNQFVVPVVEDGLVASLIVMSLSIEVEAGGKEAVFAHEPRLRDAFLQVMFDHSNMGGFSGAFTEASNMDLLRQALQDAAFETMRGHISNVLIVEIVRQDVTN